MAAHAEQTLVENTASKPARQKRERLALRQVHPAVLGAALFLVVVGDRLVGTVAGSAQAVGNDALRDES